MNMICKVHYVSCIQNVNFISDISLKWVSLCQSIYKSQTILQNYLLNWGNGANTLRATQHIRHHQPLQDKHLLQPFPTHLYRLPLFPVTSPKLPILFLPPYSSVCLPWVAILLLSQSINLNQDTYKYNKYSKIHFANQCIITEGSLNILCDMFKFYLRYRSGKDNVHGNRGTSTTSRTGRVKSILIH